jgi:hypothetical protein
MQRLNKLALGVAAGALLAACASAAGAVSVTLDPASPMQYVGACPGTIKFTGWITANGPGIVKYQWYRRDNAILPVMTLVFGRAAPSPKMISTTPYRQMISYTWVLGGSAVPSYNGWVAVHILSPAGPDSNRATFTLTCAQRHGPPAGGARPQP